MHENRESRLNSVSVEAGFRPGTTVDYAADAAASLDVILAAAYEAGQDELVRVLASVRGLLLSLSMARGF